MAARISFIGSGRVASHLATAWWQRGLSIAQVYSPTVRAKLLADKVNAQVPNSIADIACVELLVIAVNDSQIDQVARALAASHYAGMVVHTSGSTDISVISQYGLRAGVFYPLQSFSLEQVVPWQETPIFIEAQQATELTLLQALAGMLTQKIYVYDSKQRQSLHLAAVFACNFSNYCIDIAQQILHAEQVDSSLLLPLIAHTVHKLQQQPAFLNQTGPAQRQDHSTLAQHMQLLQGTPEWEAIYQLLSSAIQQRHQQSS